MEGSYFPEDKDLAHKIMMDLSNSDLVKICATNKRMYDICNNYPSFWRNKFVKDYGEYAAQYKPDNRSWKNHYMSVFIDLQKYKSDPMKFMWHIAWKDNVDNSYFIDYQNKKLIPLKEAPEWVMDNLYLLNIDKINIHYRGNVEYKNVKPIEIFQKLSSIDDDEYWIGFTKIGDSFYFPMRNSLASLQRWLVQSNPLLHDPTV